MTGASIHVAHAPDGLSRVILRRPEVHNAFDEAMIDALARACAALAARQATRVVLVGAEGPTFCAGGDLNWMRRAADLDAAGNRADALRLGAMLKALSELPQPTIAIVQGNAFGGGLGVIAACDIVLAARGARFALTEVRLGLAPAVISPHVVAAIGLRQARRYMLTAESFDADEARHIGLVHEVVDGAEALAATADALARQMLANGPAALAATKALIRRLAGCGLDDALVGETAALIAELRASPEGREGLAAFLAKRKPAWDRA
jgi:methylglutaconyl-CoA hydratase